MFIGVHISVPSAEFVLEIIDILELALCVSCLLTKGSGVFASAPFGDCSFLFHLPTYVPYPQLNQTLDAMRDSSFPVEYAIGLNERSRDVRYVGLKRGVPSIHLHF